jgi:hypothetical protein
MRCFFNHPHVRHSRAIPPPMYQPANSGRWTHELFHDGHF